jgi:hypothetical protein
MPAAQPLERDGLEPVLRPARPARADEQRHQPALIGRGGKRRDRLDVVVKIVPVHDEQQIPVSCLNLTGLDEWRERPLTLA